MNKQWLCYLILNLCLVFPLQARVVTGQQWRVIWNTPDQTTLYNSIAPEEYDIRDGLLARINQLQTNDWCGLATYTFSGTNATVGAAGPIADAVERALNRGAKIAFVAGSGVNTNEMLVRTTSLGSLARRSSNPLQLAQAPSSGIMHHKVGLFYYRTSNKQYVMSGSWNFTAGACSTQWNIMTELESPQLFGAYSNEVRELLSGRFHNNTNKSHLHDKTSFTIPGMTNGSGFVRFAPYPDSLSGGNNALTDVLSVINAANDEIFFALNKLTRIPVADALIAACNRGVFVRGIITQSDRIASGRDSYEVAQKLLTVSNYTSANRVQLELAFTGKKDGSYDAGESDLVHAKYMIVDPRGINPVLIHGSANWSDAALVSTSANDENILFLPHRELAQTFLAHFDLMTDRVYPVLSALSLQTNLFRFTYWLPNAKPHSLVQYDPWNLTTKQWPLVSSNALPIQAGTNTLSLPCPTASSFFWSVQQN